MAFNETLVLRIRNLLVRKRGIIEKKMFGGVGYMLQGNMLVGVWKDLLVVRLGPVAGDKARRESFVKEFDITGKPMKGWIVVEPAGLEDDDQLNVWINRAIKFVSSLPAK